MKWSVAACALLLLAGASPAIGSLHGAPEPEVPDRTFLLVMRGTTFNGLHAPDTPLLEAYAGERVRFVVLATEPHTFHLHGHPWRLEDGSVIDARLVDADRPHVFDVIAGGPDGHAGDWMYHCHFNAHVAEGMWGIFRVHDPSVSAIGDATTVVPGHHHGHA